MYQIIVTNHCTKLL